jgi:hypothetical protein
MYRYGNHQKIWKVMGADYILIGIVGQGAGAAVVVGAYGVDSFLYYAGHGILVLFTGLLVGGCTMYVRYCGMWKGWGLVGFLSVLGVALLVAVSVVRRLEGREKYGEGFGVEFAEPYRRHVWRMDIKVKFDETVGARVNGPITLQVARGANVGTAMKTLAGVIPELNDGELPGGSYEINGLAADRRSELSDGDELVVRVEGAESPNKYGG